MIRNSAIQDQGGLSRANAPQDHGFSQDTLAKAIGVTFQQIQKYEHGINSLTAWRLRELAQVLKRSPMYFYDGLVGVGLLTAASGDTWLA